MKKIIISILFFFPIIVFAQGYQLNLQSVRQTGMGGTGDADPQDASALFFNPGSAAFLKTNSVTGGILPVISKGVFADASSGHVSNSDNPTVTPFYVGAIFGNPSGRIRYGVDVYTPYGSVMQWGNDFTGHFQITKISLESVAVQPTITFKVTNNFGIGAGFVYGYGHIDLRQDLPLTMSNGSFANAEVKTPANSFGFNVGAYYKFSDQFAAALTYRSALKMKSSGGKVDFTVPASLSGEFVDQKINAKLPLPDNLSLGFSYNPTNRLTINLDGVTANWKPYDTITIHYSQPSAALTDTKLIRKYMRAYSLKLGAEYKFTPQFNGRIGFVYDKSPIPNDLVNPDVPDANRLSPSIGIGYNPCSKLRIDASFLYEHIKRKGENRLTDINGEYLFNLYIPGLSITYNF
ncbi:MAG: outer membrane protein transport protein [Arachidicoccus sp.]|nr:outer membrane protein transport protein [Arachidicoccus sp.]